MILTGIAIGLVLGLLAGGSVLRLASVQLRWVPLLLGSLVIRFVPDLLANSNVPLIDALRLPLLALSFALLLIALWGNRSYPGITLAFVGTLANGLAIVANGGYMPIWEPSLVAAGFDPQNVSSTAHVILPSTLDAAFLLHLGPLSDVIPIPLPFVQNVASIGDLFLTAGLAFFLFASVVRVPPDLDEAGAARLRERFDSMGATETGLSPAFSSVASLERPVVLGGARGRGASPSRTAVPTALPQVGDRIRQHPYVRLAVNGSFSALWSGQLISVLGDRIHTIALTAIVIVSTDSFVAAAFAFVVAALPNLFLSPIAGTFVDRWDHKEVLIVSDILRAALVLLIPLAIIVNPILIYPLVFLITSISIFFRPARVAILPQLVASDDLVTANSAMWIGETVADVLGFTIAGLLVAVLSDALPLAFWLDAATYLASAVLLASLVVRGKPVVGPAASLEPTTTGFTAEMREGWRFLRSEPTLLANTLQATVGQVTVGALGALMGVFAAEVFSHESFGYEAVFGFLETGVGAGNLLGGFAIGILGARIAKGRMISVGYIGFGVFTLLMAISGNLPFAIGFGFGAGILNMAFIIPSQALFQQRTPAALMGRVVSFRFALVFGAMTLASGAAALLLIVMPAASVLAVFAGVTVVAGIAGLLVPAVRDA